MKEFDFRVWCEWCDGISSKTKVCLACNGELKVWPEWEQLEFIFPKENNNEEQKKGSCDS